MRTKFYALFLVCAGILSVQQANAQCGTRYIDSVFQNVTVVTDTYSTANGATLLVDIYQPDGDTSTARPLLILAHGGSFVSGNKTADNVVTRLCNSFTERGYVCASINYRLGQLGQMVFANSAKDVVMKAISDGKAAIRFFRKDAATANKYKIDPEKVFVGGNSAGAVLFAHVAFIDSVNEAPADLRSIIDANGGIEGNSGNDGYSSRPLALLNLAGGLNEAYFVSEGNTASFNAHGDADNTVPYNCANAQGGLTPVQLCGLGALEPRYQMFSIPHSSIVYPGAEHCPWQNNTAMFREIDSASAAFLAPYACIGIAAGVNDVKQTVEVSLFPNPASSEVNIRSEERVSVVTMFNSLGQVVAQNNFANTNGVINTGTFAKGIYTVRIEFANKNIATASRKVVIE